MLSLSKRSSFIEKAEIRAMTVECEKAGGINLAQGVCDTGTPQIVIDAASRAMSKGINSYTRHDGLPILREAIAKKLERENNIKLNPENEIVVSAGSTGAFYSACLALLDPGDEVILFEPFYGYHLSTLQAVEAKPKFVTLTPPDWQFSETELESAVTKKTKAIMVCTPSNPCGKVFTADELKLISDFANKHNLIVFTDEIYEYITYDGYKHISPGSIKDMAARTVIIGGYSKTFSITGWRIGYCACERRLAERIGYVNDLVYVCAPAPLQVGVAEGINKLSPEFYKQLANDYKIKRDLTCEALSKVGLEAFIPQGAYYILADATNIPGKGSKEKAMNLLRVSGVASVPGESFYKSSAGQNLLRFCFAKTTNVLDNAFKKFENLQTILEPNLKSGE